MNRWISLARNLIIQATFILFFLCVVCSHVYAQTASCETVVHLLNSRLSQKIDEQELIYILHSLNHSGSRKLPSKFITKKQASKLGWRPGSDLWSVMNLQGFSLGGDRFMNWEQRLPVNTWREADLVYKGGRRGSKRLIFSPDGQRFITVDHYKSFLEIPKCSDH